MPADICKKKGAKPGEVIMIDGKPYKCPGNASGKIANPRSKRPKPAGPAY